MGDKFLGSGAGNILNISNGTTTLFGSSIGAINLDASQPVKTNSVRQLVSSKLDISDINNLQNELNSALADPIILKEKATPSNPAINTKAIYASSVDGEIHLLDENGVDKIFSTSTTPFLPLGGGTMTGNLDMGNQQIINASIAGGLGLEVQNNKDNIINLQTDLGTETTNRTNADTNLQTQITSNDTDILNIQTNPEAIIYEPLQSQDPIVWDTQDKSSTVSIEGDGTIFANNTFPLTGNAYSVNIIDTAIYNYTIRTTLKDVNSGNIHFVGLFGARVDPIPAFAFVDQGAGAALQGGVHFMINHSSQPSIQYRTSFTSNTSISDSSGAGDLEVAEDYLEFTITDSVITQVNKNGSPLVFTGANFNMTPKKYYFGYHDLNTITGSIRIKTDIISKTLRSSVNTDGLNYKLSNLQNQITASGTDLAAETTNRTNADTNLQTQITSSGTDILNLQTDLGTETTNRTNADTNLQTQITSNDTDILNLQTNSINLASTDNISSTARNTQYIIKGYKNSFNLPAPSRLGQIINFVNIQNEQQYSGFLGTDLNGTVRAIVSTAPYTILGGQFTTANGVIHNRAVRFNHRTLAYEAFGTGFNDQIRSLHLDRDGTLWLGGRFTQYNGINYEGIISYDLKTQIFTKPANQGINHSILTTEVSVIKSYQNKVYMGGVFETANNKTANNIVEYDLDAGTFTELQNDTTNGVNGQVRSFEILLDGGYIWLGGTFTAAGSITANNFIQYEVQTNLWENVGNLDGDVYAVEKYDEANLVVAGNFQNETKSGTALNYIAFYNVIRREWSAIPNSFGNRIEKVLVLPNGVIAVAGLQTVEQFDVWYKGEWFQIGSGFNNLTTALNYNNFLGTLEIGGNFSASRDVAVSLSRICQIPINSIIKYNGSVVMPILLGDNIELKARDLNYWI